MVIFPSSDNRFDTEYVDSNRSQLGITKAIVNKIFESTIRSKIIDNMTRYNNLEDIKFFGFIKNKIEYL